MNFQKNSQELSYQSNDVSSVEKDISGISKPKYFSSQIFQGVIFGWIISILILILTFFVGMRGQITSDFKVSWELYFLTIVTVITRVTSSIIGFMVPYSTDYSTPLIKYPPVNSTRYYSVTKVLNFELYPGTNKKKYLNNIPVLIKKKNFMVQFILP